MKRHVFFLDLDWTALARKEITPPPRAKYRFNDVNVYDETTTYCLGSIRSEVTGQSAQSAPMPLSEQANFRGFTFVDDEPFHPLFDLVDKEPDYEELAHSTPTSIDSDAKLFR